MPLHFIPRTQTDSPLKMLSAENPFIEQRGIQAVSRENLFVLVYPVALHAGRRLLGHHSLGPVCVGSRMSSYSRRRSPVAKTMDIISPFSAQLPG